jgi:hypothetical protein
MYYLLQFWRLTIKIDYMKAVKIFGMLFLTSLALGTQGGDRHPAGGRATAMGGASVSNADFWSIANNQAGLAWLKSGTMGFSFENRFMLADIMEERAAVAIPFSIGTFGFSINRFGNNLYHELSASLVYSRKFGKYFGAGLEFDYQRLSLAGDYGNRNLVSCQIGLMYQSDKKLTIGIHIFNPVPVKLTNCETEYLPTGMTIGMTYRFSKQFVAVIEAEKELGQLPILRAGSEYHFTKSLFARIGFSTTPMSFSFGFGVATGKFILDFASSYHPVLGFSPSGSITYLFKR